MSAPITLPERLNFLTTAGEKGWIRPLTVESMRQNCDRVPGALELDQQLDLASIDVDLAIRQFANLNAGISPETLGTNAPRIRTAIRMFADAKENPTTWKMPAGRAGSASKVAAKPSKNKKADDQLPTPPVEAGEGSVAEPPPAFSRGLSYPFPLRNDVIVTIGNVPRDMTKAEATRLSAFLVALAVDDTHTRR